MKLGLDEEKKIGNVEKDSLRMHLSGPIKHPKAPAVFCGGLLKLFLYSCSRWYDSLISKIQELRELDDIIKHQVQTNKKAPFMQILKL